MDRHVFGDASARGGVLEIVMAADVLLATMAKSDADRYEFVISSKDRDENVLAIKFAAQME